MAFIGIAVFLMVWAYSFWQSRDIVQSLLAGLTLAMSILPEEIPVAFTTFMALGSWKLMKQGVIIKRSSIVETLGSTTVICTDKTGTITENSMKLKALFDFKSNQVFDDKSFNKSELSQLIQFAMWSSEPVPFDPMEKTLHKVYEETQTSDQRKDFQMIHEYPLEGKPPMMTHIFENNSGERIIAAKGAPEAILEVSQLSEDKKKILDNKFRNLENKVIGYWALPNVILKEIISLKNNKILSLNFLDLPCFTIRQNKTFNRFSKNIRCRNKSKSNYRR
jgi:Ca2+-transporting ATPase